MLVAVEQVGLSDLLGFFGFLVVKEMGDILCEMPQELLYLNLWSMDLNLVV